LHICLSGAIALVLLSASPGWCQEWTRFRGPNGTGVGQGPTIPAQWTDADYRWKITLPGKGHSSPVLWAEQVFLLSADPDTADRLVICIDASTGRTLWQRVYRSQSHHLHVRNTFATSTPAVDDERVYVAWSTPECLTLRALDHAGQDCWKQELGPYVSQHGFGNSPIVFEDLVILINSQDGEELDPGQAPGISCVLAFDRRTGAERWRTPRPTKRACYSTPCLHHLPDGTPELICHDTAEGFYSLDPRTGTLNWSLPAFVMRTVASPLLVGETVFGCNGSGGGGAYLVAARMGKNPVESYRVTRQAPYVSTPVAYGDWVFFCSDRGFVSCARAADGAVQWSQRVTSGFSSSPVVVDGKLYCLDEDGDVWVLAAEGAYRALGHMALGEPSRATPAVAGGRLYLRTESRLFCLGGE
jgi:outer membrane protein assembly factor BamB